MLDSGTFTAVRAMLGGSTVTRAAVVSALIGVALPVLAPAAAYAQSSSDKAVAETLFREGRALMNDGKVDDACPKLEGSYRVDPKTGTLTNLAACHEMQGKTASAWAEFSEAAAQASNAHRGGLEEFARTRASALATKLSRLSVRLTDPDPKTEVTIDGHRIVVEALGTPIPLDPGVHKVVAKLGDATWSGEATIAVGPASADLTIPKLEAAAPAPVLEAPVAVPPQPERPASSTTSGHGREIATYGALGVGAVGIGVGTVFGLMTLSKKSDADALCHGSSCSSQHGVDLEEQARSTATISTIGLGVGLVGAAVGLYLLVTTPRSPSPSPSPSAGVSATVSADGWGLAGRF